MISYVVENTAEDSLAKFKLDFGVTPVRRVLTSIKHGEEVIDLGSIETDDNTIQYYDKRNNMIIAVVKYDEFSNSARLLTERKHVDNYEFIFSGQAVKFKGA